MCNILRALYRGSVARPRRWWSSCWMRLRHSSKALPARCTTWKGSMTALAPGSSSVAALLNPVNPSIATISMRSRHVLGWEASQVLKTPCGAAWDHVQESGGTAAIVDGGHVQDDGDVFVPVGGVAPHVFIHANDTHAIEPGWIIDQQTLAFSQDSGVGGSSRTRPRPGRCAPPSHDERPRPSEPSAPPHARAWHANRPLDSYLGATREHTSGSGSGARSRAQSWDATRRAHEPSA